ncbi:MAG TPA: response regulator transcription factor [Gemmatimonadaceae bacterium]|jgi:DNA-binding response OmpR family regulator|nr:response regulator transcription factor [Gemmatimonadaceae bacterium]
MSARILLVEDNADLAEGVEYNLRLEGYDVKVADNGKIAVEIALSWQPDLILLDLMLPEMDGYQVLRRVRQFAANVPVIILSARGEEADKVRGFKLDADQYVTKPFSIVELLERIAALLRRNARALPDAPASRVSFGEVDIDTASRTVLRNGKPCTLTPKAYELLLALVRRDGAVAGRTELLKEVWGYGAFIMTRTVDTHIAELRRKLESNPAEPRHIVTVWKVGYRLSKA